MAEMILTLRPAHFFSIDNAVVDVHAKTLGVIALGVYVTIARYANRKTGACWPSIGRLAGQLRMARSNLKIYLRKLEKAGLITITPRRDAAGDQTSHLYTLLDPSPAAIETRRLACASTIAPDLDACPPCEGGGSPADPPPVTSQPTGRSAADPEASHLNTKEKNQEKNQDVRASAEEPPKTPDHLHPEETNQDVRSSVESPPQTPSSTALPPALPDRPDDFLSRLDASTLARLETEARATLVGDGIPQYCIIAPVLHSAMATLWCEQQAPLHQGGDDLSALVTPEHVQALQEEDGTVSRAA